MGNKHVIDKKYNARIADPPDGAEGTSTAQQLVFTAAGAAGSALLGAILSRKGWDLRTVSGTLAGLGAALAGVGESDALRAIGAGAMSGAGAQLVLMLFAEYEDKKQAANDAAPVSPTGAAPADAPPMIDDAANANIVPLAAKAAAL